MNKIIDTRIKTLKAVLPDKGHQKAVADELKAANGDWAKASANLKDKLPQETLQKAALAHSLADWSGDNITIVKALAEQPNVQSLRDVALNYGVEALTKLVKPENVPENTVGATPEEKAKNFAVSLSNKLFATETSGVLQRMVTNAEIPIADASVRNGVTTFLANQPDFNIRKTSVYSAIQNNNAFNGIDEQNKIGVISQLKTLQRLQAISTLPETVSKLSIANINGATHVADITESQFMNAFGNTLGVDEAKQVYFNATNVKLRNEHVLRNMMESVQGSGIAMIDGNETYDTRVAHLNDYAAQQGVPLNWENLFGSVDFCECKECNSVCSPAAYYVELLQYLRNNNLDPKATGSQAVKSNPNDISGTVLEKLFNRRPDLGNLELTCANTNTVLPYIDLANEVMESFVAHQDKFTVAQNDGEIDSSDVIDVWNTEDETTDELLAQPQHTNYYAYCILKKAVYPFTLPYHQPIDAIRIFLNYLKSSRYELMKTFHAPNIENDNSTGSAANSSISDTDRAKLLALENIALDRAIDAEYLGLTQEEYIILTKEAFRQKAFFDVKSGSVFTPEEYRNKIGVKNVWEYYGYTSEQDMQSTDEHASIGLMFVKNQFLKRTGVPYADLVNLLQTKFINPNYPQGLALSIMESLRFSYRFLQTLVDRSSTDPRVRFKNLISFLQVTQSFLPLLNALLHPAAYETKGADESVDPTVIEKWVYCCFEKIGGLIVLESGDGPYLPISGDLYLSIYDKKAEKIGLDKIGTLQNDGKLLDINNNSIGYVDQKSEVVFSGDYAKYNNEKYLIVIKDGPNTIGYIRNNIIYRWSGEDRKENNRVVWQPPRDTCDIEKVRLIHLDGSTVSLDEYDRIQRFIRLWRKMGWTIDETDKVIAGLGCCKSSDGKSLTGDKSKPDYFGAFVENCECKDGKDGFDCGCMSDEGFYYDITPDFLHQLASVKKLLEVTGLELIKLLAFWTNISIFGEKSLYARLFLTHNMVSIDTVFKADKNGNYLAAAAKISDHIPVIMAALNLKADDIACIMAFANILDDLTLTNISRLYRYSLLMRVLHVKGYELQQIKTLFDDPFVDADTTNRFFDTWGKMEDAGFRFRQLNYVINDLDDDKKPLAPKKKPMLQLAKALYDGLNRIDKDNNDISSDDEATPDFMRGKISLLFDESVTEQIMGLFEGTSVYSTNAPKNLVTSQEDFTKKLSGTLQTKLKYDFVSGGLQVTGILTDNEKTTAKAIFNNADWSASFDKIGKKSLYFFNDVLSAIFPASQQGQPEAAQATLLQGDVNIPADQQDPNNPIANTAPIKLAYFIKAFLPYLRDRLEHKLLVDTLSDQAGMGKDITDAVLSEVLVDGNPSHALIETFRSIKNQPPITSPWTGYLIPPTEDTYIFVITNGTNTLSATLQLNGQNVNFTQQADPNNVWLSNPVKLKGGGACAIVITGLSADLHELEWKTPITTKAAISPSVLFPDDSARAVQDAFVKLQKAAILVLGFNLSANEVSYLQKHGADFDGLDFNAITLDHWKRLEAYARLRKSLPPTNTDLISFFTRVGQAADATQLSAKIAELTLWKQTDIYKLIAPPHFNLGITDFKNEVNLLKLEYALYVADKLSMDIDLLFDWAKPISKFWICHAIAESIRVATKARYTETDWEQVAKPLNDQLRQRQRDALISYLIVLPDLIKWGLIDADSLFEFLLIDVQMDACMPTSRIKQAISSVQLFVQRCFLGLEEKYGVQNDVLDRKRWEWMQREVLWVANRKVFLYPENWIEENLRDDKSAFFKELESELLQKDINTQTVEDALKSYLYKVDEVANMEVEGLYIDGRQTGYTWSVGSKLHVFARTRNAPYFFYYRYLALDQMTWTPWEKVQVDIPSYDVQDDNNKITGNGCFLIPVVFNNRLLIFFPQIMKKTAPPAPNPTITTTNSDSGSTTDVSSAPLNNYWEIKVAWSEYRNGKWTQKQVSKDVINSNRIDPTHDIPYFKFVPFVSSSDVLISVDDYLDSDGGFLKTFKFEGSQIVLNDSPANTSEGIPIDYFNKSNKYYMYSWQIENRLRAYDNIFFTDLSSRTDLTLYPLPGNFSHPYTHQLLGNAETGDRVDFFETAPNIANDRISTKATVPVPDLDEMFGLYSSSGGSVYNELAAPYSIYNWELFFHTPAMLADSLSKSQNYEESMKWFHYVFNPMAKGTDGTRFWRFWPFQQSNAKNYLENLFNSLKPNTPDAANGQINSWRDNPYKPHVIARQRPSAYMKWTVMKYLDNLIAWGDYLFTQHTIESINQATQLYILASHILGERPQSIPRRGKINPETYLSLLDRWDAFGNAMVEMELLFPFSNQITAPFEIDNGSVGFANIFGYASSLYFCTPNNPQLVSYWKTIEDRLEKIHHCETIEGVFSLPALWDPPIDPALLVQAAAQGVSIAGVLNDLSTPIPNYRFNYLVQKAIELCNELKSVGNSLMSIFEKKDAEVLANMRARHESAMNNLIMEVKKKQLDEASKALEGLQQNRETPVYRLQHYLKLIGEDLNKVPSEDSDFAEIANQIETPIDDSGLKLIKSEKQEMDKADEAAGWQIGIGITESLASLLNLFPLLATDVKPFGVGVGANFGGSNLGGAASAIARGMQTYSSHLSYQSSSAQRKGGFLRQLQDRILQANLAGYEIKQIDKQILSQQVRIQIANQEITNQQTQIDNAAEIEEFLRNKYTNEDLYSWMRDSIKSLYYQVYKLAYSLAKKAEQIYRFERGFTSSNFIQFGYWDTGYDGLLAGEQLYVGIKQLEAAYQQDRGYDFEITKHISLRQVNPLTLLQLRETGLSEFELPEVLFDMDFPGHYMRRTKSVSLTVPCVVGPYTSINATLRLLESKLRMNAIAKDKNDYPESIGETDDRFSTVNVPVTAIAVSSGQNDSGVFELNFKDERYMPFEGAGAISKWRIELPSEFRQFDYDTISDVIMHLRYTAVDGGDKLKKPAADSVREYMKSVEELSQQEGLFAAFDLKHEFPSEWYKAVNPPSGATERLMALNNLNERLPIFTKGRTADKILATDVYLFAPGQSIDALRGKLMLMQNNNSSSFSTDGPPAGTMKSFVIKDMGCPMGSWQLKIQDTKTGLEKLWLLVRYVLK